MKTTVKLLGALTMVTLALNARALDLTGRTYVKADAGVSLQEDITSTITGGKITFDPGFRADIAFGYHIDKAFAVEFETGVVQNSVDKSGGTSFSAVGASSDWYQVPMLVNLVYTVPLESPFQPYVGLGLGGVASAVDLTVGSSSVDDSDIVFGYQAMGGVKYVINDQMHVGVEYKFLGTSDHDFGTFTGLNDRTMNHSFVASFSYNF